MMRAAPRAAGAYPRRPGQFAASVRIDRSSRILWNCGSRKAARFRNHS